MLCYKACRKRREHERSAGGNTSRRFKPIRALVTLALSLRFFWDIFLLFRCNKFVQRPSDAITAKSKQDFKCILTSKIQFGMTYGCVFQGLLAIEK